MRWRRRQRMAPRSGATGFSLEQEEKAADEKKPAHCWAGFSLLRITSLTITYFHTGCSTIIGVESFHGPVRDGKGWDRLTMVIKL